LVIAAEKATTAVGGEHPALYLGVKIDARQVRGSRQVPVNPIGTIMLRLNDGHEVFAQPESRYLLRTFAALNPQPSAQQVADVLGQPEVSFPEAAQPGRAIDTIYLVLGPTGPRGNGFDRIEASERPVRVVWTDSP
jgi:hypothetical protein